MLLPPITGINIFPSDDEPRSKKKTKEYGQQVAISIYSCLLQSSTLFGAVDYTAFSRFRAYAAGRQDMTALRSWYVGAIGSGTLANPAAIPPRIDVNGVDTFNPLARGGGDLVRGARTFSPMDYTPVNPMPTFLNTIESIVINESRYKVECNSVNPAHTAERESMAWAQYYRSTFGRPLANELGIDLSVNYFEPKTEPQLQLMLKNGFFRMLFESGFEDVVKQTFNISLFDQWNIQVVRDLCTLGFAAGKKYCDYDTGATKIKYIDPARFVVQWSDERQGRNPSFVGHLSTMQMFAVKKMMQQMGYSHEEIVKVARSNYENKSQSLNWPSNVWYEKDPMTNRWKWEQLEVDVLEFDYVTQNELRYARDEEGKLSLLEEANRKYDSKHVKTTVYEGVYILGTQFLCKWDEAPNSDGTTSYFYVQVPGASIVERSIGTLDDIMKAVVKMRGEMWAAAPSGFYADLSAIANLAMNPADQQEFVQQLVAAYRQSGVLFGQTQFKNGRAIVDKPIIPIDNGPKNIEQYANQIVMLQNQILQLTGIPQILTATPHQGEEKAVGIGEIELISANHALWPIKKAFQEYVEKASVVSLNQIRLDIWLDDKGSRKYYEGVTSSEKMNAMLEVKKLSMEELAFTLKPLPTTIQKQQLKMMLTETARAGTRDGLVKLTESDLMYCYRLIDSDQTELAEMYAAMVIDERLKEYNERQSAAIQQQAKANSDATVAAETSKQETLKLKIQLETMQKERLLLLDKQTPSIEIQQKGEMEMAQIQAEIAGEAITGKDIKNPIS